MRAPRDTIPCPRPAPAVVVVLRRPVDVPARLVHHRGALVAEVLVVGPEGPDGQELPQDFVGFATADFSLMGEEHEVQLSFAVKLEAPKDAEPLAEGLVGAAALDQEPKRREELPDPQEVPVLIVLEVRVPVLLEEPEGRELLDIARSPRDCFIGLVLVPPLRVPGHRRRRRRRTRIHGDTRDTRDKRGEEKRRRQSNMNCLSLESVTCDGAVLAG